MPFNVAVMGLTDLTKALENLGVNAKKELRIAASKTANKGKGFIAKDVTNELAVPQKIVRKQLKSEKVGEGASLTLSKSRRLALKDFKPVQNSVGVKVRISKTKGQKTIPSAWMGPRPGLVSTKFRGNVMARKGRSRLPIRKLQGPSPWGVFVKNERTEPVKKVLSVEFTEQLRERLRFQELKKSGKIQ